MPSPQASEQDIRDSIGLGALTYVDNCRQCHQIDGYGEETLYPSLHKPALLQDKTVLIQTLINGRQAHQAGGEDDPQRLMPALDYLSNREIAAVIAGQSTNFLKAGSQIIDRTVLARRCWTASLKCIRRKNLNVS